MQSVVSPAADLMPRRKLLALALAAALACGAVAACKPRAEAAAERLFMLDRA